MDNPITSNVPDTIRQEAKARALKIIEANPGCASYVRPEDLETQALFIPVVSVIKPIADDFYPAIPKVGIMAKPQLVNLLKEKAGINITRTETSKRGDYVYVAHVWGDRRQPDGTMLTEDTSYEWDCNVRAELDYLSQPDNYKGDIAKRKHLLELAKFGEQRAVTGAQHSLIHKLAHVARSFKTPEELMRGMIVSRIDRNINGVLADPQMRAAALDRMLGATDAIYGTKQLESQPIPRTVDVESGEVLPEHEEDDGEQLVFPSGDPQPEPSPVDKLKEMLATFKASIPAKAHNATGETVHSMIDAIIAKADASEGQVNEMIDRCNQYVQAMKGRKAGAA